MDILTSFEIKWVGWKNNVEEFHGIVEVLSNNKQSQKGSRKALADRTRSYKKTWNSQETETDRVREAEDLMRLYQQEIDTLIIRCTYSEKAAGKLYEQLCSYPDPAESIKMSKESRSDLESELTKLRKQILNQLDQIKEYEREFQQLQNQAITVRKLEEANRNLLEEKASEIDEAVQIRDNYWNNILNEEKLQAAEKLAACQKKISELRNDRVFIESELASAQQELLNITAKYEGELECKRTQIEMMAGEIEAIRLEFADSDTKIWKQPETADTEKLKKIAELEKNYSSLQEDYGSLSKLFSQKCEEIGGLTECFRKSQDSYVKQIENLEETLRYTAEEVAGRPSLEEYNTVLKKALQNHKIVLSCDTREAEKSDHEKMLLNRVQELEKQLRAATSYLEASENKLKEVSTKCDMIPIQDGDVIQDVIQEKEDFALCRHPNNEYFSKDSSFTNLYAAKQNNLRQRCFEAEEERDEWKHKYESLRYDYEGVKLKGKFTLEEVFTDLEDGRKDGTEKSFGFRGIGLGAKSVIEAILLALKGVKNAGSPPTPRKTSRFGFFDRFLLSITFVTIQNSYARSFIVLYLSLLHLVVFASLFAITHNGTM